jgi:hypothetical protein
VRRLKELSPAHRRVLDLLLRQPNPEYRDGSGRIPDINFGWIREKSHWGEATIRALLQQARQYFQVETTKALIIRWRQER